MNDTPLKGLHIINTRPKHQGSNLSTQLRILGATVSDLPVIEIEATHSKWLSKILPISQFEQIIFISTNAVNYFFSALEDASTISDKTIISTIGKKTANELERLSIRALFPSVADSEHLLTMTHLQNVSQQNILIVKGVGGRRLITQTLSQKGAQVKQVNVYRRSCPNPQNNFEELWKDQKERIILVTSRTGLDNIFKMMPNFLHQLHQTTWLAISKRIATYIQKKGLKRIIISEGKYLINTLLQYQQGQGYDRKYQTNTQKIRKY